MSLFRKDYLKLSDEESQAVELYKSFDAVPKGQTIKMMTRAEAIKQREVLLKYPFIKNVFSLFPNYYLNNFDLTTNKLEYVRKLQLFMELLDDKAITERHILNFIRENEAQFIISSALNYTTFGHHDRYIFQEVALPPNHQADFLIIGKNSHGYHFILVELENPYGGVTIKDGSFGATIRKGLNQVDDWRTWLDKNFTSLKNVLQKLKRPSATLPEEFFEYDRTRFQHLVVAGRRDDFSEKTYRATRTMKQQGTIIIHYDNLIDETKRLIEAGRY